MAEHPVKAACLLDKRMTGAMIMQLRIASITWRNGLIAGFDLLKETLNKSIRDLSEHATQKCDFVSLP